MPAVPESPAGSPPPLMIGAPARPLGELLVAAGALTAEQLDWALVAQQASGSRLGAVLIASGLVDRLTVYRALAQSWGCRFVDCTTAELDPALLLMVDPSEVTEQQWIPLHRDTDGVVLVATAERPAPERTAAIEAAMGEPVRLLATTDWDIAQALARGYRGAIVDEASLGLWRYAESRSARRVVSRWQGVLLAAVALAVVVCAVLLPIGTLVVLSWLIGLAFLVGVLFKFVVCLSGARFENVEAISPAEVAALDDADLPRYTVLVPVYREAAVLPDLMANLAALDYPTSKLDVIILLEENDPETWAAARAMRPPGNVRLLRVPAGAPQTKPKACNVGLFFARGDYLVIYDAEDRPDPDQLKKAVIAFRRGGDSLVCVQAALNYFNAEENALTRMFTAEYSFWFDYMLPGLDAHHLPIPLGGTSNHFRTDMLRRLGGWDPFNVTEDADLGIRASVMGRTVGVINSTTLEEANTRYGNFIRQRSRWIKGYLQTTLVHLRHPVELLRTCGFRQAAGFALLVGGTPLTFLTVPPLYLLFVVSLLLPAEDLQVIFPGWVLWISLANLLIGTVLMIYVSMMGAFKRHRYGLVLWALLNPLYWLLHSIAAYKALWQLMFRPHYWEKTVHGLTSYRRIDPTTGGATDSAADDGAAGPGAAADPARDPGDLNASGSASLAR